jgi:abortive infection bacteriophage resistance protein
MAAFTKPATTLEQQLANLRQRGLLINDEVQCRHFLSNISYFRLSAYIKPLAQYIGQEAALETNRNPFALLTLVFLQNRGIKINA